MKFNRPRLPKNLLRTKLAAIIQLTLNQRPWIWFAAVAVSGFLAFYWDASASKASAGPSAEDSSTASTLIPAGYVLVPIEVANYESLDSILGNFGVVDLYQPSENPQKRAHKIAERLKILRAPLNPSHFAVLAREADSARLVSHPGPFTVIVQNPNHPGTSLVKDAEDAPDAAENRTHDGRKHVHSRISVEVTDEN